MTLPQPEKDDRNRVQDYLTAKEVSDIHRNSDVDLRYESQHHTLGMSQYQASPGNHTHDGESGVPLLDGVNLQGNYSNFNDVAKLLDQVIKALAEHLGAKDLTVGSPAAGYVVKWDGQIENP